MGREATASSSKSPGTQMWDIYDLIGRDSSILSQIYHSPVYLLRLVSKEVCSFSHWITAVVVVDFDVNEGHRLAEEYPPGLLSEKEKERLIRMSLPDSNAMADAGLQFHLTTPGKSHQFNGEQESQPTHMQHNMPDGMIKSPNRQKHPPSTTKNSAQQLPSSPRERFIRGEYSVANIPNNWLCLRLRHDSCLSLNHSSPSDQRFSVGVGIFRSVPDANNKRHAKQESVVLLTPLPISYFSPLLLPLSSFIANSYFTYGLSAIYDACASVGSWPMPTSLSPPVLRLSVSLSMSSDTLCLEIPSHITSNYRSLIPFFKTRTVQKPSPTGMMKLLRSNSKRFRKKKDSRLPQSSPLRHHHSLNSKQLRSYPSLSLQHGNNSTISRSQSTSHTSFPSVPPICLPNAKLLFSPVADASSTKTSNDSFPCLDICGHSSSPPAVDRWTPKSIMALWLLVPPLKRSNSEESTPSSSAKWHQSYPPPSLQVPKEYGTSGAPNFCQPLASPIDKNEIPQQASFISDTAVNGDPDNSSSFNDEVESVLSSLSSLFALDPSPLRSTLTLRSRASSLMSAALPHELASPSSRALHQLSFPSMSNLSSSTQSCSFSLSSSDLSFTAHSVQHAGTPDDSGSHKHRSDAPIHLFGLSDSFTPMEGVSWDDQLGPGHQEIIPGAAQILEPESMDYQKFESSVLKEVPLKSEICMETDSNTKQVSPRHCVTPHGEKRTHFLRRRLRRDKNQKPDTTSRLGYLRETLRKLLTEGMRRRRARDIVSTNLHQPTGSLKSWGGPTNSASPIQPSLNVPLPMSFPRLNMIASLGPISLCLWSLWEVMVTGAPLLVLASNATRCSSIVLSLLNLIHPLQYGGDFRPYLNSFDPDLVYYRESLQSPDSLSRPSILIGASDPLLLSVFSCCPNIVVVEAPKSLFPQSSVSPNPSLRNRTSFNLSQTPFGPQPFTFRYDSSPIPQSGKLSSTTQKNRTSWLRLSVEGSVPKDPKISKRIADVFSPTGSDFASIIGNLGHMRSQLGTWGGTSAATISRLLTNELEDAVSSYFHDLTLKFLKPFDSYLQLDVRALMRNPLQEAPRPGAFIPDAFLDAIGNPTFPVLPPFSDLPRTKLTALYRKFISTRTFRVWFHEAQIAGQQEMRRTQFSYCAAINPSSLFPRLSLSEATEGCAYLRLVTISALVSHLLRDCEDTNSYNEVAKVRSLEYELKQFVVSSFGQSSPDVGTCRPYLSSLSRRSVTQVTGETTVTPPSDAEYFSSNHSSMNCNQTHQCSPDVNSERPIMQGYRATQQEGRIGLSSRFFNLFQRDTQTPIASSSQAQFPTFSSDGEDEAEYHSAAEEVVETSSKEQIVAGNLVNV